MCWGCERGRGGGECGWNGGLIVAACFWMQVEVEVAKESWEWWRKKMENGRVGAVGLVYIDGGVWAATRSAWGRVGQGMAG